MKTCHACMRELSFGRVIGRRDECPFCRADVHCCLNCRFYDPAASKQCREPAAELVRDKKRANYCDYFVFNESRTTGAQSGEVENSRKAFDDLFKKK
jgi:hypothetical protein